MSTPIHQEVTFHATPLQVYRALMDSTEHAAFTGAPAAISPEEGGPCSWYGGAITGRNIELVANERIVQVWRAQPWSAGVYSVIKIELVADGDHTRVVLDHTGHPEGTTEHLAGGWQERYWKPLEAYFART